MPSGPEVKIEPDWRPEAILKQGAFNMLEIIFAPKSSATEIAMATSTLIEVIDPSHINRAFDDPLLERMLIGDECND